MTEPQTITQRSAVITGASAGIGAATARHLAQQGVGVVLVARSEGKLQELADEIGEAGGKAAVCAGDVGDPAVLQRAVAMAGEQFGPVDLLVNNAGLIDPIARIEDSDPAQWAIIVDVNLKGVYYGLRCAIPVMKANVGGTIINISSGAATGALEGWSHYCATKAAVLSLTKCVDKEEAENGIRMIGLSPGTVATEMQTQIKASGINPVSQLDWEAHIPAEWVAQAIAFLCTSAADEWRGQDFSLKTDDGRAAAGLPPLS
ncbi:MAG: SDR family oxidoreductase [Pseudomonadota bacterium]